MSLPWWFWFFYALVSTSAVVVGTYIFRLPRHEPPSRKLVVNQAEQDLIDWVRIEEHARTRDQAELLKVGGLNLLQGGRGGADQVAVTLDREEVVGVREA